MEDITHLENFEEIKLKAPENLKSRLRKLVQFGSATDQNLIAKTLE